MPIFLAIGHGRPCSSAPSRNVACHVSRPGEVLGAPHEIEIEHALSFCDWILKGKGSSLALDAFIILVVEEHGKSTTEDTLNLCCLSKAGGT